MSYLFKYYSKQYDSFMKLFKLDNNKALIEGLGDISKLNILDVGGGTGTLAARLIDLGAEVTILDPEVRMTDIAKQKNCKVNIINAYSNNIPLKAETVDLVVFRDTFHHIMEQKETLKECKRVLKKGGRIIIYDFDRNNFITKLIIAFERSCFEKIKMLTIDGIDGLTASYFTKLKIRKVSSHEYIYQGLKE